MYPLGSILHADLDSFFASVEQRDDPALRGRPVAVGGGVVLAASYEAKAHGVRSAMGGRLARSLCPGLVVVPPRMEAYSQASKDVFAVFADTTPLVEAMSIDEAFLDVGGLLAVSGTPVQIATRLRERVRDRGRPRHHRRDRADEVPGQGGVRRRQARRPAVRAARGRARVPALAAGREALGRRGEDGRETARARDRQRRPGRGARARQPGGDARPGLGPSPVRARPQPRSPPGRDRAGVAARSAPNAPGGTHRCSEQRSTRTSSRSSTARRAGCGRPTAPAGR